MRASNTSMHREPEAKRVITTYRSRFTHTVMQKTEGPTDTVPSISGHVVTNFRGRL